MTNDPFLDILSVENEQDAMKDSIGSAVRPRRGQVIYQKGAAEKDKEKFRNQWAALIRQESQAYLQPIQPISDVQHCDAIERISKNLSQGFGSILDSGTLRYGVAQKAFNLYLKYLWRLKIAVVPPPHCPLDDIVLKSGGLCGSWTKSNSRQEYMDWIEWLRVRAGRLSLNLPDWEYKVWLDEYSRRRW